MSRGLTFDQLFDILSAFSIPYIINVAVSAIHVHQICIGKHLSKFADVVNVGRC